MAATIHIHHRIAICYCYSAQKLILFYHPMEGGRLIRPRHCRKGAQPVPKAVHRSGCRDKRNWPRPLIRQSIMPSLNDCDLLRHVGVNNFAQGCYSTAPGRELNSQHASCKSNALATRLPSHHSATNGSKVRTVGVRDDDMRRAAIKEPWAKSAVYD